MDSFRTTLDAQRASFQINHSDRMLLVGSCFTEHIGVRLLERKFRVAINPNGIVYNPVSMATCLKRLWIGNQPFEALELFEHMGLWHSWEHHSHFSKPEQTAALEAMNAAYDQAGSHLQGANRLLFTLGTADVFMLHENSRVVANNHKMPGSMFRQKRLSVAEVTDVLSPIIDIITAQNPGFQVILSVSPVRHLRNGLVENQRSKAVLVLACDEICRQHPNAHYFPAYELLQDDLRDYRFYAADMVHPSEVAVDYIWKYFSETFFNEDTRRLNMAVEKIAAAARHRPFNPQTPQHQAFAKAQLAAIAALKKTNPELELKDEEIHFAAVVQP